MQAVILGTGPSLNDVADLIRENGDAFMLFGVNNTFRDFELDVWIACDPAWHNHFGLVTGTFDKWHWDRTICDRFGYQYIEGRWFDGLSPVGSDWISYNHCSGAQALNLATSIYECERVLLVGHDFHYEGNQRHYFSDLSNQAGEYPAPLRKFSKFDKGPKDGLVYNYRFIAEQDGLPPIINCTPGSKLPWFPFGELKDFL